jgi:DNA-directed RNA polymerase sigma subunit (sigma70/sigma32)
MSSVRAVSPEEAVEAKERSALRAVDAGDSLAQYMTHIGRVPLLTQDEEVELAKRIKRG